MLPSPDSPAQQIRGSKLLVVDDDRLNIRILHAILQGEGFVLETAETGEDALALCETFQPDLVLLDVVLPGIDGFETCRRIRQQHGAAAAPVIFITAKAESDDVVAGLTAGGVDYLPKPFRAKEAVARIRTHLHNRRLLEQLSRANAAKNRFLGMAAHDLRNPLASIRGLAEFLQDPMLGTLNDEQLDLARTIQSTSTSMLQLVNELLDVATIEAGELRIRTAPCDLVTLIEKAVSLANLEAARKQTRILFAEHPPQACARLDEAKVRQILENLLSNAVKYSPPGSTIRVHLTARPDALRLGVLDQGPGIPDNERDRLFKDFGCLSAQPTAGEKSTGLGLAICRKIVEAHGGTIGTRNLPDRGCEFHVTFPLCS